MNIADSFSRLPLNELDETSSGNVANEYVKFIVENNMPDNCALLLSEVREETAKDKTLIKIMNLFHSGAWSVDADIKPFEPFREEFSVYDGVLLRGDRIVVPTSLQRRFLKLEHETHVGIVRTKQLLRSMYFWVGMDKAIESTIKDCPACAASRQLNKNTPLRLVQLPKGPWLKGAVDIVGPIDNKYLVTYVDYFSSFPEAAITRDISSKSIVKILVNIFARHSYPEEIVSDNGPYFVSQEFNRFLSSKGIKHVRSSPYFPRSNGKIERLHRYLKKNFQAITVDGRSWEEEKILMSYRSILHPMTGKTSASLLFHREIRTELPSVKSKVSRSSSGVAERIKLYQKRMKSYHDSKHRAKAHSFAIGDIVYPAWTRSDGTNKLKSKFDTVKYLIIDFVGRDTCKVVSTLDGKVYIRNVKFLTRAPMLGEALIFDDIDDRENSSKFNIRGTDDSAKDSVIRTRSGHVSKPTRFKDFVYY